MEIDQEDEIEQLQEKIKEKLYYRGRAETLGLYLALKNGEWLTIEAVHKGYATETMKELTTDRERVLLPHRTVEAYFVGQHDE